MMTNGDLPRSFHIEAIVPEDKLWELTDRLAKIGATAVNVRPVVGRMGNAARLPVGAGTEAVKAVVKSGKHFRFGELLAAVREQSGLTVNSSLLFRMIAKKQLAKKGKFYMRGPQP